MSAKNPRADRAVSKEMGGAASAESPRNGVRKRLGSIPQRPRNHAAQSAKQVASRIRIIRARVQLVSRTIAGAASVESSALLAAQRSRQFRSSKRSLTRRRPRISQIRDM